MDVLIRIPGLVEHLDVVEVMVAEENVMIPCELVASLMISVVVGVTASKTFVIIRTKREGRWRSYPT